LDELHEAGDDGVFGKPPDEPEPCERSLAYPSSCNGLEASLALFGDVDGAVEDVPDAIDAGSPVISNCTQCASYTKGIK